MKQVVNLFGASTSTTGLISFTGQPNVQSVSQIAIPQGMKLRIFRVEIDGQPTVIQIQFNPNPSSSSSSWIPIKQFTTTATGHYVDEYKSRPLVIYGMLGTEAIEVSYTQSSVGGSTVAILGEFAEAEEGED